MILCHKFLKWKYILRTRNRCNGNDMNDMKRKAREWRMGFRILFNPGGGWQGDRMEETIWLVVGYISQLFLHTAHKISVAWSGNRVLVDTCGLIGMTQLVNEKSAVGWLQACPWVSHIAWTGGPAKACSHHGSIRSMREQAPPCRHISCSCRVC